MQDFIQLSFLHRNALYYQWNVKCRLRAPDHSWCFKSLSRIITIQGFILQIITGAKKYTISRLVNFLTT